MSRAMHDPTFRADQLARLRDGHVAPLNALVETLRERHPGRPVPSIAATSAGTGARVLALHRAPVPPADGPADVPLASIEGDDPASERLHDLVTGAGIDPAAVLPWYAVPYAVAEDEPLSGWDVKAGRAALEEVVRLLPRLRAVVVHGRDAEPVWAAFTAGRGALPAGVRVEPVAFATTDAALSSHRASRLRRLAATYASVADALR